MKTELSQKILGFIGLLAGFIASCMIVAWIAIAFYETTFDHGNTRVVFGDDKIVGWVNHRGQLAIKYYRDFTVLVAGDIELHRTVRCRGHNGIDEFTVTTIKDKMAVGEYKNIWRHIETPIEVFPGEVCSLKSAVLWRTEHVDAPKLSIIGEIAFTVLADKP